jgi:branched-subunit amino acid ABC-type transport system permease component
MSVYELFGRLAIRDVGTRRISTGASVPVLGLLVAACIFLTVGSLWSSTFAQLTVSGVAQGSVFASLALALVLIYRATEVINFAQGEMALFTTYIAYQLTLWGLSYWAAFFATLGIAFFGGIGVQQLLIRPVQHKSVIAVVIVSIGLLSVIDGAPTMMQPILIYAFAAAVLGGLESPMGAVVSGIALGIFLNLLGQYGSYLQDSALRLPVSFAVLLIVLLIRPTGLFGRAAVRKV